MNDQAVVTPWPEALREHYYAAGYWENLPLYDVLDQAVQTYADNIAVVDGHRSWTYQSLQGNSLRVAALFSRYGLAAGDAVVLHLPNSGEFVEALFACFYLGVIPVLALPAHRFHEINGFMKQTNAKAYIGGDAQRGRHYAELLDQLAHHYPSVACITANLGHQDVWSASEMLLPLPQISSHSDFNGECLALLQLSGGTTSTPKLIPRTHNDYLYSVKASAGICGLGPETRYLVTLPMAHNFTLSSPGVLGVLHAGGMLVIAADGSPDTCFPLVEQHGITMTALVPPLANIWLQQQVRRSERLTSLKLIQVGGAKLSEPVASAIPQAFGCTLQQVFGMAEGLVNYTRLDDSHELTTTTQGRPISPHDEIKIVDDNDEPVAPGQEGHLLTRGPYTIRGYYKADEHNRKSFTADGFYRTGDIVQLNEQGYLIVTGRAKDQINRGGEKIAADEVEDVILSHPDILDVALVSTPDQQLGEKTCAFLLASAHAQPLSIKILRQFLRDKGLASYKIPDRFEYVAEFPKTHFGKVSKKALRERLSQNAK